MKYSILILLLSVSVIISTACNSHSDEHMNDHQQTESVDQHNHREHESSNQSENQPLSPDRMAMSDVGNTHVHIEYSAPSVREREIWGELVPFDGIWVTGAHMATSIQFMNDLLFDGNPIPAGKYALFTIPGEEEWTVILNENWNQHLTDEYDPELDVLRFEVTPQENEFTEQLTFVVHGGLETGSVEFMWENVKFSFSVEEQ